VICVDIEVVDKPKTGNETGELRKNITVMGFTSVAAIEIVVIDPKLAEGITNGGCYKISNVKESYFCYLTTENTTVEKIPDNKPDQRPIFPLKLFNSSELRSTSKKRITMAAIIIDVDDSIEREYLNEDVFDIMVSNFYSFLFTVSYTNN